MNLNTHAHARTHTKKCFYKKSAESVYLITHLSWWIIVWLNSGRIWTQLCWPLTSSSPFNRSSRLWYITIAWLVVKFELLRVNWWTAYTASYRLCAVRSNWLWWLRPPGSWCGWRSGWSGGSGCCIFSSHFLSRYWRFSREIARCGSARFRNGSHFWFTIHSL